MMIVNGSGTAGVNVWEEIGIAVTPNTDYYFSAWAALVYYESPAKLDFSINGNSIGTINLTSAVGLWNQFYVHWNSGSNTTANILALVNQNTAQSGNDFALDNIKLDTTPVPLPPTALLLSSSLLGLVGLGWRRMKNS